MNPKQIKIGCITYFYKSRNYGAILQSYASVGYLRALGYDAEQIQYKSLVADPSLLKKIVFCVKGAGLKEAFRKFFGLFARKVITIFQNLFTHVCKLNNLLILRNNKFEYFANKYVRHSDAVYDSFTINECNKYDIYIAGSDQIWTLPPAYYPLNLDNGYWLKFVKSNHKIAYAISPSFVKAASSQFVEISVAISNFMAISTREINSVEPLKKILKHGYNITKFENLQNLEKHITNVVDPVFLLSDEKWRAIEKEVKVNNRNYVFCYFLGGSKKYRNWVKNFCRNKNLYLVDCPHMNGRFRWCDANFSDQSFFCGPREFLYLIDNSKYVFTDSFHATAFSLIFKKEFYSFMRYESGKDYNSDRIYELLNSAGCASRFIRSINDFIDCDIEPLNFDRIESSLNRQINHSKKFLSETLARSY